MSAPDDDRPSEVPTPVPTGVPTHPSHSELDPPTNAVLSQLGKTKDSSHRRDSSERRGGPAHIPGRSSRQRITTNGLIELSRLLLDRDVAVLDSIASHHFLTTAHVHALLFADHASPASGGRVCRRVLHRLETALLIARPGRSIGDLEGAAASSVWMLTTAGKRLLNLRAGLGAVGIVYEPGDRLVRHYLAIADVHVGVARADRAKRFELLRVETEPDTWRRYLAGYGGGTVTLKPDLFAAVAGDDFEAHLFIEVDMATESVPTVIKQCRLYEDYRRSGVEQDKSGLFPRVLWLVPSERRADLIREAIDNDRQLDSDLFIVTTHDRVVDVVAAELADDAGDGGQA